MMDHDATTQGVLLSDSAVDERIQAVLDILVSHDLEASVAIEVDCGCIVGVRNGTVDSVEHCQSGGMHLVVYDDGKKVEVSSTEDSPEALFDLVSRAKEMLLGMEPDVAHGLPDVEEFHSDLPDLQLYHPYAYTAEELVRVAEEADQHAIDMDARIVQSFGTEISAFERLCAYGNTRGLIQSYRSTAYSFTMSLVAEEGGGKQTAYDYDTALMFDGLTSGISLARSVSTEVLRQLSPRRIKTQSCPVVFQARVARTILGHVLQALSGVRIDRHTSFLSDAMGAQVMPERYSLMQEPHSLGVIGSAPFDAEGVATRPCCYVDRGQVVEWVLNSYTARRLQRKTTGNAGGIYHLEMPCDGYDDIDLLRQMDCGVLVTKVMGSGVDLNTGTYSRGAFGYWVEGGEIQYPIENFTVASTLQEMLMGIVGVSREVDRRGGLQTGAWLVDRMMIGGES